MRYFFIFLFLFLLTLPVIGYPADSTETGWAKSLTLDFTTTQTSYSDSWTGGEAGSFNWVTNTNGSAEKLIHKNINFKSSLKLSFGQTATQNAETKDWSDFVKSTDLIDWENVAEFKFGGFVDPYAAFRLETQFYDGRIDSMKQYFSPFKLTESAGIIKVLYKKKKQHLTSRLGLGLRQIIKSVVDTSDAMNFKVLDSTLTDGGIESVTDAALKLSERIRYTGKLTLFKAFFFSGSDDVGGNDYWKAVDVNWENIFSAQVSKIITVNLYAQLLYDKEISKKGRFKETLAVGFIFNLI